MPPSPDLDLLDSLSRDELIARARELGTRRPEVMTRVELRDEIVRLSEPDVLAAKRQRGWLGVARDLVASVVESGLNMRDAAAKIRGEQRGEDLVGPPPVATVTLAEIYIAQGHPDKALAIVDEVLDREPDHVAALALRERLRAKDGTPDRRRSRVQEAQPNTPLPPPEASIEQAAPPEPEPESEPEPEREREPRYESEPEREPEPDRAVRLEPACVLVSEGGGWTARWQDVTETGLVLRIVAFVPGRPYPQRITRDVVVGGAEGSSTIVGMPAQAVVRGALGALEGEAFHPRAVAVVVDEVEGQPRALYRPPGQGKSPLEQASIF